MSFLNFTLNYKYIMMPGLSLCDGSREHIPLIVATVISTSNRTETRRAIRETWASPRESQAIKTGRVLVFFLLSAPLSIHELYVLRKEQKKHNDLIVTDLPETYENLVFKVYASMVFHQQYCPMARFLMKVDDDVVVHLDRMLELWTVDDSANMSLFCQVWPRSFPKRNPKSKCQRDIRVLYFCEWKGGLDAAAAARNINSAFGFARNAQFATGSEGFDLEMKVLEMKTEVGRHHFPTTTNSKQWWKRIRVKL
ncbi:unnamed protein product [Heligmosomoides polygyrus]|uniref:Hexosyltransferase n=1 Tax=Heligmosomoides polygyrus TaxID=6339 RepID=A0A3P7XXQ8_HELPZ|nr:unnamed protein product [Heligmosomoides polygyrus]